MAYFKELAYGDICLDMEGLRKIRKQFKFAVVSNGPPRRISKFVSAHLHSYFLD
jgi:hypothetical protein